MTIIPENRFYNDWDQETLGQRHDTGGEYRNAFEIDRDRIIHSTAFRRLQGKTQVYVTGRSDQYRTRLTHSIEVAQIGRSLVNFLNRTSTELGSDFYLDPALVEAACLAHDLGNPPIGHRGEAMLNELMDPWDGFEGNAQSLRILTHTLRGDHRGTEAGGMHATRACLDAVLKYKIVGKRNTPKQAKFLYPDQREVLDWVHEDTDLTSRSQAGERVRSIECNIMDLADDIAYTTSDLYDGFKQGLVTTPIVDAFLDRTGLELSPALDAEFRDILAGKHSMARFGAFLIGRWIHALTLIRRENSSLESNRYAFDIHLADEAQHELDHFQRLNYDLIYSSDYVRDPEAEGVRILETLFRYYRDVVLGERAPREGLSLPMGADDPERSTAERMRIACDWVSGMTDNYALRMHKRLTTIASE